ncbi:MAG: LamB/YcsF family protein [Candidatus Bathyarchaeota archaeon]|nr:LamB/YcsF family protein [Candidatus Bathyarchaeota archaeon]
MKLKKAGTRLIIDLNSDMGESFGRYKLGLDEEIIKHITSANVACGFHAGCPRTMRRTVRLAKQHGVALGAHPSFPDLVGFGRRAMAVTMDEAKDDIVYQVGALQAFAKAEGVSLQHVKAHGEIYNLAHGAGSVSNVDADELARAIAEAVAQIDDELILVMMAGSRAFALAEEMGVRVAGEAFADRAYTVDGKLVSRRMTGAVITDPDEVAARVTKMAIENKVTSIDGKDIDLVSIDTICVHGDTPTAVELVKTIRANLKEAGIEVAPIGTFL